MKIWSKFNIFYRTPLKSLSFASSLISINTICKSISQQHSHITEINISRIKLTVPEVEKFCQELSNCKSLNTLILQEMKVDLESLEQIIASFVFNPFLQETSIDISYNEIDCIYILFIVEFSTTFISLLRYSCSISTIKIKGCKFNDYNVGAILESLCYNHDCLIKCLDFSDTITDGEKGHSIFF